MLLVFIPVGGTAPSSTPVSGGYYVSTPAGTANSSGTPVKVAGTTTALLLSGMTMPTNNRLQNNSGVARRVLVIATLSAESDTSNVDLSMFLYKTGSQEAASETLRKIATMNDVGSMSVSFPIELDDGDYVEVWIDTDASDPSITANKMVVTAHSID